MPRLVDFPDEDSGEPVPCLVLGEGPDEEHVELEAVLALVRLRHDDPDAFEVVCDVMGGFLLRGAPGEGLDA